ncbi:hypothetical protein KHQ06_30825 [Nocardia tengchongensis]|uniref:DAD domain-containing protein n=1 Tax=Nocardia tengchongensis TaxID=2055889 RepID=A0ABX8CKP1_9NOCA|nr:hypothetical protein [Nocardia tengchongensis]QVI20510.1 hypothetical protein KHQ06_30825 [Nocardia tengchongensis]
MTAAREIPDPWAVRRTTPHWIPSRGLSNGLAAHGWGVLADLDESQVYRVLFALSDAGIAGYVLPVPATVLEAGDPAIVWRLSVDIPRYRAAEDLLMELLRYGRARRSRQAVEPRRRRRRRVALVRQPR